MGAVTEPGEIVSLERAGVLMADAAYRQVAHERDVLAKALGDVLVAIGGATEGMPLTGPQLLLLAADAVEHFGRSVDPS